MSRTDDLLASKAADCDDCVQWLDHCRAECCRQFNFRLGPNSDVTCGAEEVRLAAQLTPDLRRYYEMHGAYVIGTVVVVPRSSCDFLPDRLRVTMRCSALQDDCLCALHPGGKPHVCRELTWETAHDDAYVLTPKCLFAHKIRHDSAG